MSRRRRSSPRRRDHAHHPMSEAQLVACIPAGGVSAQQMARVEIETVTTGLNKNVLVTRQVVSTPIRKLMEAGLITSTEFGAAVRWREDYEQAFLTSRNPLECVQVDGESGGGDINTAMFHKALCAIRFQDAEAALGPKNALILRTIVLEEREGGWSASFTAIGSQIAPAMQSRQQQDVGRGASIVALQHLAWIYEHGAADRRHLSGGRNR